MYLDFPMENSGDLKHRGAMCGKDERQHG